MAVEKHYYRSLKKKHLFNNIFLPFCFLNLFIVKQKSILNKGLDLVFARNIDPTIIKHIQAIKLIKYNNTISCSNNSYAQYKTFQMSRMPYQSYKLFNTFGAKR